MARNAWSVQCNFVHSELFPDGESARSRFVYVCMSVSASVSVSVPVFVPHMYALARCVSRTHERSHGMWASVDALGVCVCACVHVLVPHW